MASVWSARCPDIHCDGCADSIRRSLGRLGGVEKVEVDIPERRVTIQYDADQTNESALRERLDKAGFPVE